MIVILTRPPKTFFKGAASYWLKFCARKALGKVRGPEGVLQSLMRGLNELGRPFSINKKPKSSDTVHVLSNIEALRYAIREKHAGRIGKLIAGPNLVVMPDEHDCILASPEIDKILIVSPWVRDIYALLLPDIIQKSAIWPAGVQIPAQFADRKNDESIPLSCILFIKKAPAEIIESVQTTLEKQNIPYRIFKYGTFNQQVYFDALLHAGFMIYLQEFESQGIALQEAWARDVPTLVWNKGTYRCPDGHDIVGNVSAPFLTPETGMLFGETPFETALAEFLSTSFSPRAYCTKNLSDKASAQIYLNIISS